MKKSIFILAIIALAFLAESSFSQNGQKWSTSGNSIVANDFLGTTNNEPLVLKVNNNEYFRILENGRVGIGTKDPLFNLHIIGNIGISKDLYLGDNLIINGMEPSVYSNNGKIEFLIPNFMVNGKITTKNLNCLSDALFDGNVGIGTNNPQYKLDVLGNVRISENLYVGGGIVITDKVRASGDIKSTAIEADSIKMDSTKAFYGFSKFADAVKLESRLDVYGNTFLWGNLTTSGTNKFSSFSGNGKGLVIYDEYGILKPLGFPNNSSKVLLGDGSWGTLPVPANYWNMNGDNIYTLTPGNVGIGTSTPQVKLDVDGDVRISNNLYVGGGIVISDKVNATTEVITKDLKSMSLKADSIIMDSTKAFYGDSRFAGDVKLDYKLKVNGDAQFNGNFTTSGNIKFAGNQTIGYLPASGGNPETRYFGTQYHPTLDPCFSPTVPLNQFEGVIQSWGANSGHVNVMQMGFDGANAIVDIAGTSDNPSLAPRLLINYYCGKDVFINTGLNGGNVVLTSTGNVGVGTDNPTEKMTVSGGNILIKGTGSFDQDNDEACLFLGDNNHYIKSVRNGGIKIGTFGAPDAIFLMQGNGNVGVGVLNADSKLSIGGNIHSTGNVICGGSDFILGINDGRDSKAKTLNRALVHDGWEFGMDNLVINYDGDFEDGVFVGGPKTVFDGVVGIGTSNIETGIRLSVNGKIIAEEIEVIMDVLPDYVFDNNYKLMSIEELEKYIKQNKHLPEIPSADDVKNNGMNVGEMNALLLKKIEEQALYIIYLEKRIDEIDSKINSK